MSYRSDNLGGGIRSPRARSGRDQAGLEVVPIHAQEKYYVPGNTQPIYTQPAPPLPLTAGPPANLETPLSSTATWTTMPQQQYAQLPPPPPPSARRPEKTICGLRRATAILSALLFVVIAVACVVGGAVGTMAVSDARNDERSRCLAGGGIGATATASPGSAATAISSSSSSSLGSAFVPPQDVLLALDCPGLNNTRQTIRLKDKSYTFTPYCGADYNGVTDLVAIIAYSFRDCLQACASMNLNAGRSVCNALEFNADMSNIIPNNFGTCFLKASSNTPNVGGGNANAAAILE